MSEYTKTCQYCGGGIFFQEDLSKPRKPDGSPRWTCYNIETNTVHLCTESPYQHHTSEKEMWKRLAKLPVYCYDCGCYYLQDKVCSHLEAAGFQAGITFPGRFHEKYISEQKRIRSRKKNSTTLYNSEKFQEKLNLQI